jgi:putative ABC transport system permease protein
MTFVTADGAIRLSGSHTSPAMFPMLGVDPILGRSFGPANERPGADKVVLLAHSAWQTHFGGDAQVVGRSIVLDGEPYSVVGVMPPGFRLVGDDAVMFWIPLAVDSAQQQGVLRLDVIARLKDGVSIEAAATETRTMFAALRGYLPSEQGPAIDVVRWQDALVAPIRPALLVFVGAVSLVLMIACLNVINLFLARSTTRRQELAVRVSLGANRGRVVRQFLAEGLLLTMASAVAALGVALGGIRFLKATGQGLPRTDLTRFDVAGSTIPRLEEIGIDGSVILYTLALAVATGAFFSITPALRAWRMPRIGAAAGGASTAPFDSGLFSSRNLLVVCQVSLTVVLLTGAGLLIRSFLTLTRENIGYDAADVLTFQTVPGAFGPAARDERVRPFLFELIARLERTPSIEAAAFTSALPMVQGRFQLNIDSVPGAPGNSVRGQAFIVSERYFDLFRVPLVAGRTFGEQDRAGSPRAFVINRTLAAQYFGTADPVGKPLTLWSLEGEVVGVVADVRQLAFDRAPEPQLFMDARQHPTGWPLGFSDGVYVAIRTDADAAAIVPAIRRVVRELDPTMPIDSVATMDEIVSSSVTRPRADAVLMGIFAAVALVLAAVGVYGVVAYFVTQRTREIGIRVALGARRPEVLALVLRRAAALTATGLALGLAGALGAARYLAGMLYGVAPVDVATFAGVTVTLGVVATIASCMPARRAAAVDPVVALRYE